MGRGHASVSEVLRHERIAPQRRSGNPRLDLVALTDMPGLRGGAQNASIETSASSSNVRVDLRRRWTVTAHFPTVADTPTSACSVPSLVRRVTVSGPSTRTPSDDRHCVRPHSAQRPSRTLPRHGGETQSIPRPLRSRAVRWRDPYGLRVPSFLHTGADTNEVPRTPPPTVTRLPQRRPDRNERTRSRCARRRSATQITT